MTRVAARPYGLPRQALDRLLTVFRDWPQIERVTLFGSRARGDFRPGSDIDLCLHGASLGLSELLAIAGQIDDLLLPWTMDLSLWHQLDDPALRDQIARDGVVFYERRADRDPATGTQGI